MNKPVPEMIHVELPCGGTATVSVNAHPETLAALDALLRAAEASLVNEASQVGPPFTEGETHGRPN